MSYSAGEGIRLQVFLLMPLITSGSLFPETALRIGAAGIGNQVSRGRAAPISASLEEGVCFFEQPWIGRFEAESTRV
jgi:hypothetical protein